MAILSGEGEAVPLVGLRSSPPAGSNHQLAEWLEEVHEVGRTIGYRLIGFHAAAALLHHLILGDDLTVRMLPSRA
jgi:cytochrome b561